MAHIPLIIEDGSGKPDAQAYVSISDVSDYADLYGLNPATVNSSDIMRATQFLEGQYFSRWVGIKRTEEQALSWPRSYATRRDGYTMKENSIPKEVRDASCALAIRTRTQKILAPDIARADVVLEEEVGPIRVKYAENAPVITLYRDIEIILIQIVRPLNFSRVVRT